MSEKNNQEKYKEKYKIIVTLDEDLIARDRVYQSKKPYMYQMMQKALERIDIECVDGVFYAERKGEIFLINLILKDIEWASRYISKITVECPSGIVFDL